MLPYSDAGKRRREGRLFVFSAPKHGRLPRLRRWLAIIEGGEGSVFSSSVVLCRRKEIRPTFPIKKFFMLPVKGTNSYYSYYNGV